MGDKVSPLDGLFDGKEYSLTFYDVTDGKGIGVEVIADSLVAERESELLDAQKNPAYGSFSFGCKIEDDVALRELLFGSIGIDNKIKADIIVEGKPYINRPKNLKYPNKRRKMRILKKWAKRFGTRPTQKTIIKDALVEIKK